MKNDYILSCESTADLPYSYIESRNIPVLFYSYTVDSKVYVDDMGRDSKKLDELYAQIDAGKLPSTSQINEFEYICFFEELLQRGDVFHIAFGSGMTPSVKNAQSAAEKLKQKYPERKITVIDSLCSCVGYGMLVETAADLRDSGYSMEELEKWVLENRLRMHHQFFSTDMTMFRRSGRVSGPAAAVGTILGICPIMRLNEAGKIVAYDKVRGKKNAIATTVDEVLRHYTPGGRLYIAHSDCYELACETRDALKHKLPKGTPEIKIEDIGTIIVSHCGRGTVAVFFFGDERKGA